MLAPTYYHDGESAVAVAKLARDSALKLAVKVRVAHRLAVRTWDDQPMMFLKDEVPID